ncbi:DDB1- and CUL4-associated factor 6-like isoform X2 [Prorops nasuta]|uniref:DDB1- and CUL4-associated factor 6-like isoform X2 n=1 Tax=Prorops nasuta TaxID=863751 RepID=UPI0034CE1AAE
MKKTRSNIFNDIYYQPYNDSSKVKLFNSSKASLQLLQRMSLLKRLEVHNGCVNSICWNTSGDLILSGSDDQHLVLTNPYNYEVLTDYKTSHRANIFSAKFLPNSDDHRIVSCSGDGIILYTDLLRRTETFHNQFTCHSGTTYEIATIPGEPHSFLSCGEDGTVRCFDLRIKDKCNATRCKEDVLICCQKAVTALSVNPVSPHQIAIGCSDSTVRTFDRRTLGTPATGWTEDNGAVRPMCSFTVPEFEGNSYRITSLSYSPDGQDVLVSYSSDHLYLFSIKDQGSIHLKKNALMKGKAKKHPTKPSQPVRRLRLRGDWSDTGPDARPEREGGRRHGLEFAQARPVLHNSLMQRMTDVLSRMLNDPVTRAALSGGGEDNLQGVIDRQLNVHNNDEDHPESNSNNHESQQLNRSQSDDLQMLGNHVTTENRMESLNIDEPNMEQDDVDRGEAVAVNHPNSVAELSNTDTSVSNENAAVLEVVPMETDSSQITQERFSTETEALPSILQSNNSGEASLAEESCTEGQGEGNMMENLQDRLSSMREGFLEKHGSEPAVNLTYSDRSSTSATISLGVANEFIRDNYLAGPSGSQSRTDESVAAGPSNESEKRPRLDTRDRTEPCVDSDDEDIITNHRSVNPIEAEMDEAIANARAAHSHETFDDMYLTELCVKQKYTGHRNARTMIKEANFWGDDFVMSGSDCGHVFIWKRDTARLCMLLEADQHVVNCLQPHPFLPILATSGIDFDVKLWAPINDESNFDEKFADDLKKRNAVMLEETKDTITVPAVFMIRMLACLNQIRRGRGRHRRRSGDERDE